MSDKDLKQENEELKKRLEQAEKEIHSLTGKVTDMESESRRMAEDMAEQMEDLEAEASLSAAVAPNPAKPKADYEQKTEKVKSFNYRMKLREFEAFGWEKIREFQYKDGGYRYTLRRDMNDPAYRTWRENEALYSNVICLRYVLSRLRDSIDDLKVTYKEISKEPEFSLTGWRKLFGIRTKEQKAKIKANVKEINEGYDAFRKEAKEDYRFVFELADNFAFGDALVADKAVVHPCKRRVSAIIERYGIKERDGQLSMDVKGITYSFSEKRVKLVCEE